MRFHYNIITTITDADSQDLNSEIDTTNNSNTNTNNTTANTPISGPYTSSREVHSRGSTIGVGGALGSGMGSGGAGEEDGNTSNVDTENEVSMYGMYSVNSVSSSCMYIVSVLVSGCNVLYCVKLLC